MAEDKITKMTKVFYSLYRILLLCTGNFLPNLCVQRWETRPGQLDPPCLPSLKSLLRTFSIGPNSLFVLLKKTKLCSTKDILRTGFCLTLWLLRERDKLTPEKETNFQANITFFLRQKFFEPNRRQDAQISPSCSPAHPPTQPPLLPPPPGPGCWSPYRNWITTLTKFSFSLCPGVVPSALQNDIGS